MTEPPGLFDLPDPQEEIATSDAAAIRWWIEPAVGLWPQLADTPDLPRCSESWRMTTPSARASSGARQRHEHRLTHPLH